MLRVFISSTSEDLYDFRHAVKEASLGFEWLPVMMENFGTSPEDTVDYCCRKVKECDLLVLLVAFRQGWVPSIERGGDSVRSITSYELETARKYGIPVRVLLSKENWPGDLWDTEAVARDWVIQFRKGLHHPAVFFDYEAVKRDARPPVPENFLSLVRQELTSHRDWLFQNMRQALALQPASPDLRHVAQGFEQIFDKAALPRETVWAAFRFAHPGGFHDLPRHGDSILIGAQAVNRLCALPQSTDGSYPLLRFIYHIIQSTEGAQRTAFLEWYQQVSGRLAGGTQARIPEHTVASIPVPVKNANIHVVVRCEPSIIREREMLVEAWLYENGSGVAIPLEKEPWNAKNRSRKLAQLYNAVLELTDSSQPPIIEFMVPRKIASEEFDQWEMLLEDMGSIRIGEYCPVVVRFVERCKAAANLPLRRRWSKLAMHLKSPCQVVALDEEVGTIDPKALWVKQRSQSPPQSPQGEVLFRHLSLHESIACVVLHTRPKEGGQAKHKDVFQALLATGVPVSLWPRSTTGDPDLVEQCLLELLKDQPLEQLPWRVRQHRLRTAPQAKAASRLTLVWDNPERVPPTASAVPPLGLEIHG